MCWSDCGVGVENRLELIGVLEGLSDEESPLLLLLEGLLTGFPAYEARSGEVPIVLRFSAAAAAAALLEGTGLLLEEVEPIEATDPNDPLRCGSGVVRLVADCCCCPARGEA